MKNEFGTYLEFLRRKYKITLRKLSDMTGISYTHISNVENGNRKPPSIKTLNMIATALGVSSEEKEQLIYLSVKQNGLPEDVVDYMLNNTASIIAVKAAQELGYNNTSWGKLIEYIKSERLK